jgi:Fatty acid hydroxylase superfamily
MSRREELRARIGRWYRGEAHFAFTFVTSLGVIALYLSRLHGVRPLEWLAVPAFFLFCGFVEHLEHRYLLHQRRLGGFAFRIHTIEHHAYFTLEEFRPEDRRDYFYVLFPPLLLLGYMTFLATGFGALFYWLVSPNVGFLVAATAALYFFLYELIHFGSHLEWQLPLFKQLGEHHRRHHKTELMTTRNFNVVLPLFDWLFGTLE